MRVLNKAVLSGDILHFCIGFQSECSLLSNSLCYAVWYNNHYTLLLENISLDFSVSVLCYFDSTVLLTHNNGTE
jgi:hypothetical protein